MSFCQAPGIKDGEHRWEWAHEGNGITTYRCKSCGETMEMFQDTQGA
jgi:hypothetical protein